jgi:hypothetical protein
MQKRDEEGPHLAEVYRIKMWLRCLPSLGGNISECGVGRLACRLDHVALDARDEPVDRELTLPVSVLPITHLEIRRAACG